MKLKLHISSKLFVTSILIMSLMYSTLSACVYINQKISSTDGLSNSAISIIHKDSNGVMWFGSWDGLNRFDGKNIHIFKSNKKDPSSISSNVIIDIIEPSRGVLWINTTKGINKFNTFTRTFTRYFDTEKENTSGSSKTYQMALGVQNLVLCYSDKNSLQYFDENSQKFTPLKIDAIQSKKILELKNDEQGKLFFITKEMKLFCLQLQLVNNSPKQVSCKQLFNQLSFKKIFRKSDSEFWLIDKDSKYIYSFNAHNLRLNAVAQMEGLPKKTGIQTITEFNNKITIGFSTSGFFSYNPIDKSWIQNENTDFNGGVLSSFYDKNQQILWVGTSNNGVVNRHCEQLYFSCIQNKELSPKHATAVRAISEDHLGRIWIGNRGNGLTIITNTRIDTRKIISIPEFSNKSILSICQGSDNLMFVGSESDGLFTVNTKSLKVTKIDLSLCNYYTKNGIPSIYHLVWNSRTSSLWMGTNNKGVFQILFKQTNGDLFAERIYTYNKKNNSGLKNNTVFAMLTVDRNHIWISTRGSGLFLINVNTHKAIRHIHQDSPTPLSDNDILCLHKSTDNAIWVGTSYGLNKMSFENNKIKITQYNIETGLINNTIHGILEDKNGIIWLSTNNGISKINPKNNKITNYNNGYGLQSNEFSDGASFKSSKEELFFGGVNGLNYFLTSSFDERIFKPQIVINDITINNTSFPLASYTQTDRKGDYVSLKHNQNFFAISFNAIDYINNANCEYAYILEGFNKEWVTLDTRNIATFTNVEPGSYILKIKATNGDKVWNKEFMSLRIKIDKPWWLSFYAYYVYTLLIILLSYVIYKTAKKRLELKQTIFQERMAKKEQLVTYEAKMRFFTNIAHEFCTPLTLIYGPCEKLLEDESLKSASKKYLHIIRNNAERMQRLINDLMDFRRVETDLKKIVYENIDIPELANYISDSFTEFSDQKQIEFNLHFHSDKSHFISDRDALEKILFNLVSNAYKYTNESGNIQIDIDNEEHQLIIKIKNTGKFIKKEDLISIFDRFQILDSLEQNAGQGKIQRNGIGLALTKSLVTILDGEINVESIENNYTTFTVILPAKTDVDITVINIDSSQNNIENVEFRVSDGNKPIILIVDDEADIRNLLNDTLSSFYEIVLAKDGMEAIETLKHQRPELIISDIVMPNMTGLELLNEIKNNKLTSHIPVIFLSTKSSMDQQISNYDSGIEFFIPKPFSPKYVLSVVNRIIHNRNSMKQYFNSSLSTVEEFNGNFVHTDEKEFLIAIVEIIKNNLENEQLAAEFICHQMNLSRNALYRKIKDAANTTPTEFIRNIRLKEAERLIKTTKLTIQEIMFQTGFNNKSYFYTIFKIEYGSAPNEYRKNEQTV